MTNNNNNTTTTHPVNSGSDDGPRICPGNVVGVNMGGKSVVTAAGVRLVNLFPQIFA
jgi:hypothetical protein